MIRTLAIGAALATLVAGPASAAPCDKRQGPYLRGNGHGDEYDQRDFEYHNHDRADAAV